jgi:hypothetical protein
MQESNEYIYAFTCFYHQLTGIKWPVAGSTMQKQHDPAMSQRQALQNEMEMAS